MSKKIPDEEKVPRGRPRVNHEQTIVRLQKGTLARADKVLVGKEKRAQLLREAVEREITRRENGSLTSD